MPQIPGISGSFFSIGDTTQSHVDVPMILTNVPVVTPEPIAP